MSLDYSKLSDDELEAIANDDYSKLSDRTLRQLTRDPSAQKTPSADQPEISLVPQAVSAVKSAVPEVVSAAKQVGGLNAAKTATANIRDVGNVASILGKNVTPEIIEEFRQSPFKNTAKLAGAYVAGHPYTQTIGNIAAGARNIGGALVSGAVAPESAFLMPYQMAAYEQDKIRANPNAPGLEYNPYAQVQRGEFATQGQAAAANQRRAVINQPFGNVTPAERALLEEDQQRKMRLMMQVQAAKRVLGQQ